MVHPFVKYQIAGPRSKFPGVLNPCIRSDCIWNFKSFVQRFLPNFFLLFGEVRRTSWPIEIRLNIVASYDISCIAHWLWQDKAPVQKNTLVHNRVTETAPLPHTINYDLPLPTNPCNFLLPTTY